MGGYAISRESEETTLSLHMSNVRCPSGNDRDRQPGKDKIRSNRCLVTQNLRSDDDETGFKAIPRSSNLVDGFTDYEHLLPNITHGTFYILDGERKVTNKHYHTFDNDVTAPAHKQATVSRTLAPGRADRINKSRRISPNATKELSKDMNALKRSELPKTPMSWSSEDDILLRDLKELRKLGWKEIAAYFPKRTAHACQFRWRRLVSGTLKGHKTCPSRLVKGSVLPYLSVSIDADISKSKDSLEACETSVVAPEIQPVSRLFHTSSRYTNSGETPVSLVISSPSSSSYLSDSPGLPNLHTKSDIIKPLRRHQDIEISEDEMDSAEQMGLLSGQTQSISKKILLNDGFMKDNIYLCRNSDETYNTRTNRRLSVQDTTDLRTYESSCPPIEASSWTTEEDSLLLNRRLSFDEVSILLHHRSEEEIWVRMGILRSSISKSGGSKTLSRSP